MNQFSLPENYSLTLVGVNVVNRTTYSLATAAHLAGVHPEMLRYYCQLGLFGEAPTRKGDELVFDDDALYELRRFEQYRQKHQIKRSTLRLICRLWQQVERLETELRFLRNS